MYYFIGRIKTLSQENKQHKVSFNIETSIKFDGNFVNIAYDFNKRSTVVVPEEFDLKAGQFNFISQHSREKFKIGIIEKQFTKSDNAKNNNNCESLRNEVEENHQTKYSISEVMLLNE